MPVPALPPPHLVLVEPDLPFGQCEALLNAPALSRHPCEGAERGARGREDDIVREVGRIAAPAAHKQPVVPPPLRRRELQPCQAHPRPVIPARPLRAFSRREALPRVGGELGRREAVGTRVSPAAPRWPQRPPPPAPRGSPPSPAQTDGCPVCS